MPNPVNLIDLTSQSPLRVQNNTITPNIQGVAESRSERDSSSKRKLKTLALYYCYVNRRYINPIPRLLYYLYFGMSTNAANNICARTLTILSFVLTPQTILQSFGKDIDPVDYSNPTHPHGIVHCISLLTRGRCVLCSCERELDTFHSPSSLSSSSFFALFR